MAEYSIHITAEASKDLDDIFRWIATHSEQNALRLVESLRSQIHRLADFPGKYEVYRRARAGRPDVHSMAAPPYIVYFTILEAAREVRILTIRHGARRQPRSFGNR